MKKAIVGYGGHAREVLSYIDDISAIFVDDVYADYKITLPLSSFNPKIYEVMVCIGDSNKRFDIVKRLPRGTQYFTYIHPTAIVASGVYIGEGSFIGAYSTVNTNCSLGIHSLLNRACHIGHDSKCNDFLSMMPGSIISGSCNIGWSNYLGTNSSIKEKINTVDDVVIGAGGVVVKDITEPGVYVGIPVKKIKDVTN